MLEAAAILCNYSSRADAILALGAQLLARYLAVVRFASADELAVFAASALWIACKLEDERAILTVKSVSKLISEGAHKEAEVLIDIFDIEPFSAAVCCAPTIN